MRTVVVVGPGGLGGTVAALLARQPESCEVSVVTRPGAHADAMRRQGLRIEGLDNLTVPVDVVDDARQIEACDALIIAVKAQDTVAALERVAHIRVGFATSLQNGTTKDDILAATFGRDRTVGAVALIAGERPQPGAVRWTYNGGTSFGELDGRRSERVDWIAGLFTQAGLKAEATDAILSATWSKMVGWIPIGLFATLSRRNNAQILSDPQLAREYIAIVRELCGLAAKKSFSSSSCCLKASCQSEKSKHSLQPSNRAPSFQAFSTTEPRLRSPLVRTPTTALASGSCTFITTKRERTFRRIRDTFRRITSGSA